MYVCLYNFYLNKLLKLFILLKEIIMIIKTHIKLILNSKQNKTYEHSCCLLKLKSVNCDMYFKLIL